MQLKVTNRGLAEVIKFDIPYIVISIYSSNSEPANITKHPTCLGILQVQFDDVESDDWQPGCKAIAERQALQIWNFRDMYKDLAQLCLIHCDAGTCRSPAVAAAISRVIYGDDKEWFARPYLPNMKVYKTMLKVKGLSNEYS